MQIAAVLIRCLDDVLDNCTRPLLRSTVVLQLRVPHAKYGKETCNKNYGYEKESSIHLNTARLRNRGLPAFCRLEAINVIAVDMICGRMFCIETGITYNSILLFCKIFFEQRL